MSDTETQGTSKKRARKLKRSWIGGRVARISLKAQLAQTMEKKPNGNSKL